MTFEEVIKDIQQQIKVAKQSKLSEQEARSTKIVHLSLNQVDALFGKLNYDNFVIQLMQNAIKELEGQPVTVEQGESALKKVKEVLDKPEPIVLEVQGGKHKGFANFKK